MNTFLGCDTDQMNETAEQMVSGAEHVERQREVMQMAQSVVWNGPDAEGFRERLHQAAGRILELSGRLRERAQVIRTDSEEQEQASLPDGGGSHLLGAVGQGAGAPGGPLRDVLAGAGAGSPTDAPGTGSSYMVDPGLFGESKPIFEDPTGAARR